jgi:hypothetical protein
MTFSSVTVPYFSVKTFHVAGCVDQRLPLMGRSERQIQLQVQIHSNESGDVFSAFDISRHPMHRIATRLSSGRFSRVMMLQPPDCG